MKVILLVPCLMLENNRKANFKGLSFAKDNYDVDEIVVNNQEFLETDFMPGIRYLHRKGYPRQGFVGTRNQLLEYFYKSDADYAIWMDANAMVSRASLNDFDTVIQAAKRGEINCDVVYSTLGINISGERIDAKKCSDYRDNVYLINFDGGYDWLHGMLMVNFYKKYGVKHFIDKRCDPRKGASEDIYLARLFKRLYDVRLCPTIIVSKPSNKTSTWMQASSGYKYPKVDNATVDAYIDENVRKEKLAARPKLMKVYKIPRTARFKELLKPYKPRSKIKSDLFK